MIIINGKIITWTKPNIILENQAILIQGNTIHKIGKQDQLLKEFPAEERVDAHGQYVMPGLICAHTHFYSAFSRGLAGPGESPAAFPEILDNLWWKLDRALDEKGVYYSAWVSILDAIRHGTTTLFDHHASPNFISDSLDVIAQAVSESGIRASLCYEVTDRNGVGEADLGIRENVRFINKVKSGQNLQGRLASTFGLHASLTLSNETLEKARMNNPVGSGFHIHAAEHEVGEYDSLYKSGLRVVDRLKQYQILMPNTIVAHGVHIDAKEALLLAESGAWLTHQPRSNMNNAVGIGDIESFMRIGVKVCLGNDGFSNTMWDEWKVAYLVHKLVNRDPRRMNGNIVTEMAIYQNSKLATQQFGLPIGSLEEGAQADIIFVDYKPFTPLTEGNLPWHIIFGMHHSMVTATIIAGKMLYHNGSFISIDEDEIIHKAMEQSPAIWNRYLNQF